MHPRHKFTLAADGTSLAYQVTGEGNALVFANGFTTSTFYWKHLLERWQGRARLVTWDLPGHGRSGPARDPSALHVAGLADCLRRVMDAAQVERATLVGFSFGSQIVLEAWRHFPERIAAICSLLGPYERPFDTLVHPVVGRAAWEFFSRLDKRLAQGLLRTGALSARLPGGHAVARGAGLVCPTLPAEEMRPFYEHLAHIDVPTWLAMGRAAQAHSCADILTDIDVPVLVLAGARDSFAPVRHVAQNMASRLRRARLVTLAEATHTGLLGYPGPVAEAMEAFWQEELGGWLAPGPSAPEGRWTTHASDSLLRASG